MPRNGSGTYSQPAGTAAISNAVIASVPYNNLIADIGNELTSSLPVTGVKAMAAALPMGGFRVSNMADPGAAQDAVTRAFADANYAALSTYSTYVGGTSTGTANAQVLATLAPTNFTLTAGNRIVFIPGFTNTGACTMTANALAAKNIFKVGPAGAVALSGGEIVAAQIAELIYDGTQFVLIDNAVTETGPVTTLASAATTDLGTIPSRNISITGTTPISAFGSTAQTAFPFYLLTFTASTTLVYNATSMILNGGQSFVTAAGDSAIAIYLGTGNWRVVIFPASGNGASLPQGYLLGFSISNNGSDAVNDIDIATGTACASVGTGTITLASALTKQTDVAWSVGTNQGGLDTGAVGNAIYYVWVIMRPDTGVVDVLFSLSSSAPTMPTNYTIKRRLGWIVRSGGTVLAFNQFGDRFMLQTPFLEFNDTNPGTAKVLKTISCVSPSLRCGVLGLGMYWPGTTVNNAIRMKSSTDVDQAPVANGAVIGNQFWNTHNSYATARNFFPLELWTFDGQIQYRLNASGAADQIGFSCLGWVDLRGRI